MNRTRQVGVGGWWFLLPIVIGAVALLLLAVLGVETLADVGSSGGDQVAPPHWMENVTSACGVGPGLEGRRVFAYNGVPFQVEQGAGC